MLTIRLNPFFADAMSMSLNGRTVAARGTPTQRPGTQDNPYEVRSIDQLQFINWN